MNKYFKKLTEMHSRFPDRGFMCHYECFMGDFNEDVPFDDHTQTYFPVLNNTEYANINTLSQEEARALGELSQIPEPTENHYNKKIEKLLNMPLSKDMFKEHSLFLMKEHCKLFSPYNNKARELLDKLIQL
jgi:hypothetical protein